MNRMAPIGHRATPDATFRHTEVCITCADQAVSVQVVELLGGGMARVDTGASVEEISIALVDAVVGDTLLVHAGVAIGRIQP